ncbi:MAG: hypothetical protein UY92_C0004G0036 [Candidatus Magasanikbacteria bacterium GW2011_GWA2_56_11]|uniref:Uncharacterized protein n=1 Tax=Candidatus Magasanikbacteria bacterium GW2011_GWA2_56_11 TaxID=1619044 RepID=A0A0G1YHN3_9BACT|nr:MAG: hypothetical protein UY92_C0004G0036 [Candidatus Magasanikbacteria bacterium GW2011_GWA2_56_11]
MSDAVLNPEVAHIVEQFCLELALAGFKVMSHEGLNVTIEMQECDLCRRQTTMANGVCLNCAPPLTRQVQPPVIDNESGSGQGHCPKCGPTTAIRSGPVWRCGRCSEEVMPRAA